MNHYHFRRSTFKLQELGGLILQIGLAIAIIVVVGSNGNPVAVDKVESEITQPGDLETSESILKIIEKKIAHWLKVRTPVRFKC